MNRVDADLVVGRAAVSGRPMSAIFSIGVAIGDGRKLDLVGTRTRIEVTRA